MIGGDYENKWRYLAVGLFLGLVILVLPGRAKAAETLFFGPASGTYKVGDEISATLYLDSQGQAINAAEATVNFSAENLEYESVSSNGSIFTFLTSNPSGNSRSVTFGGGLASPGYNGSSGKILTITWKAKAVGLAMISITGGKVLANDGTGTNVFVASGTASFMIEGAASTGITGRASAAAEGSSQEGAAISVTSDSHPDQNRWYNNKNIELSWNGGPAISGYSFDFDQKIGIIPAISDLSTSTTKIYENVADGVWYFHLIGKTSAGLTVVYHYKVQIDTIAPKDFTVAIDQEEGPTNPQPKAIFDTSDETSGLDKYLASIDDGSLFEIKSGENLPKQRSGQHTLTVTAYDKAGNTRQSKANFEIAPIELPKIRLQKEYYGLMEPIKFVGVSNPDDVIVVYLDDKEVDRFVPQDEDMSQIEWLKNHALSKDDDEIIWEYQFKKILPPGEHTFRFARIDKAGAESARSEELKVNVEAVAFTLGSDTIHINYVVAILGALIIALLFIIVSLLGRRHLPSYNGQWPALNESQRDAARE